MQMHKGGYALSLFVLFPALQQEDEDNQQGNDDQRNRNNPQKGRAVLRRRCNRIFFVDCNLSPL